MEINWIFVIILFAVGTMGLQMGRYARAIA
jgi:hypothetical protein